ncbi:hypothetical protein [Mycobacterium sp. RTGN5]|uniref:hypothetical protein n=1 Tax=Mycobacterium sp. RTGN5 TaxID=3016522 RepID=UPI0029C91C23|nr:hypothetical protein [Mycobacterium sp. RTGN5]
MTTNANTNTTAFDEVIAAWQEKVPCGFRDKGCKHPARWWINMHGCKRRTICTYHFNFWVRECEAQLDYLGGIGRCKDCKQGFDGARASPRRVAMWRRCFAG